MPRLRRVLAAAVLAVVVGGATAACGGATSTAPPPDFSARDSSAPGRPSAAGVVRVGSADSAESRLVAEIYATGLQIRGVTVERHLGQGGTTALAALRAGTLDLTPEYTGDLLASLDPGATATAPDDVYRRAAAALPPSLRLLDKAPAQDRDTIVVTRPFADANNLHTLADLARLCGTVTLGGPPGFAASPHGLAALARTYGCTVRAFRPPDAGGLVADLRSGVVQAAVLRSTDTAIPANDLVPLDDPRDAAVAQNVVPLIAAAKTADPRVTEVLNKISSQLDTAVLTDLDRRLAAPDRPDASEVARDWLASAGVG